MELKGKLIIKTIDAGSKNEHKQAYLQTDELIRIRDKNTNPLESNNGLYELDGKNVIFEGETDPVTGTFIGTIKLMEDNND